MAWSTLRRATEDDIDTLNERAVAFAERHNIDITDYTGSPAYRNLECALTINMGELPEEKNRLARLWKRIINRALHTTGCDGIAYGYVGSHQD